MYLRKNRFFAKNKFNSGKVYFFWKISTSVEVNKNRIEKRPFDYAQGDERYVISTVAKRSGEISTALTSY